MVDDKLRIPTAVIAAYPAADLSNERIGDLLDADIRSRCARREK